jgi:tetratricopeptide (TPR) repeat protein
MLMRKLFSVLFLFGFIISLSAGMVSVVLKDGSALKVELCRSDASGNLFVKDSRGDFIIIRDEYKAVKMPLPEALDRVKVLISKKQNKNAESVFLKVSPDFDFPGIRARMRLLGAKLYKAQGAAGKAITQLEPLFKDKIVAPDIQNPYYSKALFELGELYCVAGKDEKAIEAFKKSAALGNPETAVAAFNKIGNIYLAKNLSNKALQYFFQSVSLLGTSVSGRESALGQLAYILKQKNVNKYKIYLNMLKKQYPGSKFISRIENLKSKVGK